MKTAALIAVAALTAGCTRVPEPSPHHESGGPSSAFHGFVEDYFKAQYQFRPTDATGAGFHEYDSQLEDLSEASYRSRIQILHSLGARLAGLRREPLSEQEKIDAAILDGQINSELLDLERLQVWRKNPMGYVGLPGYAVDALIKRDFAPKQERLRSVVLRLRKVPAVIEAMKHNVQEPPREFTDLAIRMAGGSVGFFRDSVAAWAKDAAGSDQALAKDFEVANRNAIAAIEGAVEYLKKDLLPRSTGQYAIGRDAYAKKLLYEDMVDTPLDKLLEIGERNLEKDRRAFIATARRINPAASPVEVMKSLSANHPTEQTLVPAAREMLESLRQFLIDRKIITLPSDVRPTLAETPPYARSGSFASMDTPGAYERRAKEAFYYITPPEKDWTPQHKEEHLRAFSRPVMDIISVHEAYPGHFTQFLYVKQFPTKTRKLLYSGTNVEGWAHYTEQMMIEEGLGEGDPKFKLAQLAEALVRDARYVVGIKLHTQGMTVEQGTRVFVEKAFQERANGFEEARRGAYNPTYLYYTLGKLQIYKLREDYRRAKGSEYSLQKFHDEFMRQGGVPMKIMRQILLPGDTGPVL